MRHGEQSGESHGAELAREEGREGVEIAEHVVEERVCVAELLHAGQGTRTIDDERRADHEKGTNLRGEKKLQDEQRQVNRAKSIHDSFIQ